MEEGRLVIGRGASVAHQSGRKTSGVPIEAFLAGKHVVLCRKPELLFARVPEATVSYRDQFGPPPPRPWEPLNEHPSQFWIWGHVDDTLAWMAIVESYRPPGGAMELGALPEDWETVDIPLGDLPSNHRCMAAMDGWDRMVRILRPAWEWTLNGTAPLPPADLLTGIVDRVRLEPDVMVRTLCLGLALVLGQDAALIATGRIADKADAHRREAWRLIARDWIDFLSDSKERSFTVRALLDGRNALEQFRTAWLPAATLRTVGLRLGMGPNRREDFATRIGVRYPWLRWTDVAWAVTVPMNQPKPWPGLSPLPYEAVRNEYSGGFRRAPDPWPRPLDHLNWWIHSLGAAARDLFLDALDDLEPPLAGRCDIAIPWFDHALATTVPLLALSGDAHGLPALHRMATKEPHSPGSYPNDLRPEASPQHVTVALADAIAQPQRNLAADVEWAIHSIQRYRRIERFEAELLIWWRGLLFPSVLDLWYVRGKTSLDWPNLKLEDLLGLDQPPTSFFREGWLPGVIALYARLGTWPGGRPVPRMEELTATTPDTYLEQDHADLRVGPPGSPDEHAPHPEERLARGGWTSLRWLAVSGWFLKPAARERIMQWLRLCPPKNSRPPNWDFAVVNCAVAAARLVHGVRDVQLIDAFNGTLEACARLPEDNLAGQVHVWLHKYLTYPVPFPDRPERRRRAGS